jgi:ribosome-binding ATPase YchF (GTP1/OBG family)
VTFFTTNSNKIRAWPVKKGTTASSASGKIHTDFEKNFVKAEVVRYKDFIGAGGWQTAREKGLTSHKGADYIVCDGDVIDFKINA